MPMLIGMIVATIIMVTAVILFARHLYKTADSRKIKRIIKKYSAAYEREVILSNGIGGYFFIDYLILLPSRILALNLQKIEGYVFGAERIELWTLVENNKSTKFKNPLEDVNLFVKQVADQLKFDGFMARVLFDSRSKFPKGVPEGVLQLASFRESMTAWAEEKLVAEATNKAWDELSILLAESRERCKKETG
ncbi:MAG: nuclease-related domain-containing protein [Gallionellaceae bacterium]|nr:nuclease-related domain-containing protein [Gallionellaceae bacterium]